MAEAPDIAVVVPSHDRPLRLRWLLNALEEQTLAPGRFEVIVAHDSRDPETEALLRDHPLAAGGTLRHLRFAPGPGPAEKRNA
ncbi:MAG: glycosyltransferase family 2 protein, partial [Actinomycetota bacterium]|nr:glycosyltransferase family 2 protein [Actinomycetota bacterium]